MRNYVTPATELLDLASEDIIRTSGEDDVELYNKSPDDGNGEMF